MTTTPLRPLSDATPELLPEAAAIQSIRAALSEIHERLDELSTVPGTSLMTCRNLTFLRAAVERSDDALFDVLNIAQAHCHSSAAKAAIRSGRSE